MIVRSVYEKGSGDLNEDCILISDNIFGVFDGATSLSENAFKNGHTGGFMAASIARTVFERNNDSLSNLTTKANTAIAAQMRANGINTADKTCLWNTSAAVVRVYQDYFEWVQIGDCLVVIIYDHDQYEILTPDFDHDLETLLLWKRIARRTTESIFSALADQILKVRSQMNVTYGALSGEKASLLFAASGSKPLKDVRHILIFTDGLHIPKQRPETRGDFTLFVRLFQNGGLHDLKTYIRTIEKADPDCRIYPRFKPHDDIAAISLSF